MSLTEKRPQNLADESDGERERNLKLRMQIVELQNQLSLAKQMVRNAYLESSDTEQDEMYNKKFALEDRIRLGGKSALAYIREYQANYGEGYFAGKNEGAGAASGVASLVVEVGH
eukprot:768156-Hanusia_phi.AAC.13